MAPYKEPRKVTAEVGTTSRTKQADARTTDINVMVANYKRTGQISINPREPRYGDFSEVQTMTEAFNRVKAAEAEFAKLPAKVRDLAQNNPLVFLEMLTDEGAVEALKKAGLPVKEAKSVPNGTEGDTSTEAGGNAVP